MKKLKYQIFVSSTYKDLKDERDLLIKAILELGHIPVGMEMFSAADEDQWKTIKRQIDDSDYYLVVVAFKYGSMDGDISYTEKEYDYAISQKIPALGFVIHDNVLWPADKMESDFFKIEKLKAFKDKITKKMVSFWNNKEDLYGRAMIAVSKQFVTHPRAGWVPADQAAGPEVLQEITRLSKENSELKDSLFRLQANNQSNNKLIELEEKKMKIAALPNLKVSGFSYSNYDRNFSFAIINKGEPAVIENCQNLSGDLIITTANYPFDLEKGQDRRLEGYSNSDKALQECEVDLHIRYKDRIGTQYNLKAAGPFSQVKVIENKEI